MFSNSSPSYALLAPIGAGGGGSDSGINWLLWGGIGAGVILLIAVFLTARRSATKDERE
jgi:hypothetical protein